MGQVLDNSKQIHGQVYKVTNLVSGKVYIGQTVNSLKKRWKEHRNSKYCIKLKRAIEKYGKDSFTIEMLVKCESKEELDLEEIRYIKLYNSITMGYNIREGGSAGKLPSKSIKKIKDSMLAKSYKRMPLYQLDQQFNIIKEWSSVRQAENHFNTELTSALKGRRRLRKGCYWIYKHLDLQQEIERLSAMKPKILGVSAFDMHGNLVATYSSMAEAGRSTGTKSSNISAAVRGIIKTSGGYIWKIAGSK